MPETLNIQFDDRELAVIRDAATKGEMRPETVVKRWTRLGQMLDKHMIEEPDTTVGYLDDQGDFHGFFDYEPKMAPMPAEDTWENEGGA
jgi:hypothetical protein